MQVNPAEHWHATLLRTPLGPHAGQILAESECPPGSTLKEAAEAIMGSRPHEKHECVFMGRPIPYELWPLVKPKAHTKAVFKPRLRDPFSISAAIVAVSQAIAAAVPGALALSTAIIPTGVALGAAGGSLAAAVGFGAITLGVTAAIGFGVSFLTSQLVKPPDTPRSPSLTGGRFSPTLEGVGNDFNPYGPVPFIFGEHRVFPPLCAPPYTEEDGSDTIARMLFAIRGPVEIEDLRIGETPFVEFDDAEAFIRVGDSTDPDELQLFRRQVNEQNLQFAFPTFRATDPTPRQSPWAVATSAEETEEAQIVLAFVGMVRFNDLGSKRRFGVEVQASIRPEGTNDWLPYEQVVPPPTIGGINVLGPLGGTNTRNFVDGNTTHIGNGGATGEEYSRYSVEARTQEPFFVTLRSRQDRGRYDIRIRRVETSAADGLPGAKETSAVIADFNWTKLRSLNCQEVLSDRVLVGADRIATIEIRVRITDQIGGFIRAFNFLAKGKWSIYDPADPSADPVTGWTADPKLTRNPATAFLGIFKRMLPVPRDDAGIEYSRLTEWYQRCESEGYTCDAVVDFQQLTPELADSVASTGRASFDQYNSMVTVVIDQPVTEWDDLITPVNSGGLVFEQSFSPQPHGLLVRHVDIDDGYNPQGETTVFWPGFDASNATLYEEVQRFGAATQATAYADGLYFMAVGRLRRRIARIPMDVESQFLRRGSRVEINHDTMLAGQHFGLVKAITVNGSNEILSITVGEGISYAFGQQYSVLIRHPTGTSSVEWESGVDWEAGIQWEGEGGTDGKIGGNTYNVTNPAGPAGSISNTITFETPLAAGSTGKGDLFGFGIRGRATIPMIVRALVPGRDLSNNVEVIDYGEAIFDVDAPENIPAFDPQTSSPIAPSFRAPLPPTIDSVVADEGALLQAENGSLVPRILLNLRATVPQNAEDAARPTPATWQAQIREAQFLDPDPSATDPDDFVGGGWRDVPAIDSSHTRYYIGEVLEGCYYDVRVRGVSADSRQSAFVTATEIRVVGQTSPPPDVSSFVRIGDSLVWSLPEAPIDLLGFDLRFRKDLADDFDTATPLVDPNNPDATSPFDISSLAVGAQQYMIKAVDRSLNRSVNARSIQVPIDEIRPGNVFRTIDMNASGGNVDFPGTIEGGSVVSGDLQSTLVTGTGLDRPFWPEDPNAPFWPEDPDAPFWDAGSIYQSMTYQVPVLINSFSNRSAGVVTEVQMNAGNQPDIEFRIGRRDIPIAELGDLSAISGTTFGTVGAILDPFGEDAMTVTMPIDAGSPVQAVGGWTFQTSRPFWGLGRSLALLIKVPASVYTNRWADNDGIRIRLSEGSGTSDQKIYRRGLNHIQPGGWSFVTIDFDHDPASSSAGNGALATFDPNHIEVQFNELLSRTADVQEGVSGLVVDIAQPRVWAANRLGDTPRDDVLLSVETQTQVNSIEIVQGPASVTLDSETPFVGEASARLTRDTALPTSQIFRVAEFPAYDMTDSTAVLYVYVPAIELADYGSDSGLAIRLNSASADSWYYLGTVDLVADTWNEIEISPEHDLAQIENGGGVDASAVTSIDVIINPLGQLFGNGRFIRIDQVFRRFYRRSGYRPWFGQLPIVHNDYLEFRYSFNGAPETQDDVENVQVKLDVPDIEETIDQTITSGQERLVLTKTYREITNVFVQITGSTATYARVLDYDHRLGPEIQLSAQDTVRARVVGY